MMREARAGAILCPLVYSFPLMLSLLSLLGACASTPDHSAPDHPDWIRVGVTTKDEVVTRYGQPDLVIASREGDTAIYRPTASGSAPTTNGNSHRPGRPIRISHDTHATDQPGSRRQ